MRSRPKTKLPPQHHFKLSHILAHSETGRLDLQHLNDCIVNSVGLYKKDIADELKQLVSTENELIKKIRRVEEVYNVLHNLRIEDITDEQILANEQDSNAVNDTNRRVKSRGISMFGLSFHKTEDNKMEMYSKIEENIDHIVADSITQKERMDAMIVRLKKVENRFPKRVRLFHGKSANKEHYKTLYDYGMKDTKVNNITNDETNTDNTKDGDSKNSDAEIDDIKNAAFQRDDNISNKRRSSISSVKSKISQQKLNQYLDIENELNQITKIKSNATHADTNSSVLGPKQNAPSLMSTDLNPIIYVMGQKIPTPTCNINDELITVQRTTGKYDPDSTDLVDELKKLYN